MGHHVTFSSPLTCASLDWNDTSYRRDCPTRSHSVGEAPGSLNVTSRAAAA